MSHDELLSLFDAAQSAGLVGSSIAALTAGISPPFMSGMKAGNTAGEQFLILLDHINSQQRLRDGSIPMELFLANAVRLLGDRPEADLFQDRLDTVRRCAVAHRSISADAARAQVMKWAGIARSSGTLERIVGNDDTVSFAFLAAGNEGGKAVAKLTVPRYDQGRPSTLSSGDPALYLGTGWLFTPDLVMTNYHVINARTDLEPGASPDDVRHQVMGSKAIFDFDDEKAAGTRTDIVELVAFSTALDYAVLRLATPTARSPLKVASRLPDLAQHPYQAMNIIQHPGGRAKRVALRSNWMVSATEREILYFSDTERGSSGSPVCDDRWRVVALHRAWTRVTDVSFEGKSTAFVNSGVPIGAILEDLKLRFAAVHAQVV